MTVPTVKLLEDAQAHVEQMYIKGALQPDSYYQCIVTLASDFLCKHHDAERALVLLNRCPPEYFDDTLPIQADGDFLFGEAVIALSYRLIQLGISGVIPDEVNVPGASA